MSGLDVKQLGMQVVRPVLDYLGMGGPVAEALMLGTAAQESGFRKLHQDGGGPAIGLWQMEPATEADIRKNFLAYRGALNAKVQALTIPLFGGAEQMAGNLYYACAMARISYYRSPQEIPTTVDLEVLGKLYKLVYNTPGGAATAEEWVINYKTLVAPFWG
jgi:hypothetical protein